MKKQFIASILTLVFVLTAQAQKLSIAEALADLPDIMIRETENRGKFEKTFELQVKQALDHEHPEKGYFYQRAFLSHKSDDLPMVMYISGYSQHRAFETELTGLLNANQLSVEHRYFGTSVPDSMDYSYLTIEQACADLHHINQLLKKLYKGKWLSTGISKGGATVIFYKYLYPDDVDAGVAYVAPINTGFEEKKLHTFLDTVGSDECRANILAFQKRMFRNRETIIPYLKMYSQGARLRFTYLTFEEAFEYCVLEYPFAFWQYGAPCEEIPSDTSSLLDAAQYLMKVSNISLFSDRDIDYFLPHYYQSASQLGYYSYKTDNFKEELKVLPLQPYPHAAIVPDHIPVHFDGSVLDKVHKWTREEGDRMIYIYGSNDSWTAAAIQPSEKVDAVWFFMEGKDHGSANYTEMSPGEKEVFISTLERWLSLKIIK